jgi:Flp pilus assembly protein TadD
MPPSSLPTGAPTPETPSTHESPALADLERAAISHPRDAKAQARYGSALAEGGTAQIGILYLRRAVALDPTLTAAWHNLGLAAEREGWLDVAADAFTRVVKAKPEHAGEWVKLGYVLSALGRYDEAGRAFRHASALQPQSSEPLVAQASSYYAAFQHDRALAALNQATVVNPRSAAAWANMASIHLERGNGAEAAMAIKAALKIEPDEPRYYLLLGRILALDPRAEKQAEARSNLEQALNLNQTARTLAPLEEAETNYRLGLLARESGNPERALSYWRQAHAMDPTHSASLQALGQALMKSGGERSREGQIILKEFVRLQRLRVCEQELRQRVEKTPNDGSLRLGYGQALLNLGNVSRAVWELREAVRLRPQDTASRSVLADALRRQGRKDEAAIIAKQPARRLTSISVQ